MNMKTLILIGTFALSLVIAYPMMSLAQFESQTGNQSSSESQSQRTSCRNKINRPADHLKSQSLLATLMTTAGNNGYEDN